MRSSHTPFDRPGVMKPPRIVPIIGMSLALVIAAPLGHAEPVPTEPAPTSEPSEPAPSPEPSPAPSAEPSPAPPAEPSPEPTPQPTSPPIPEPSLTPAPAPPPPGPAPAPSPTTVPSPTTPWVAPPAPSSTAPAPWRANAPAETYQEPAPLTAVDVSAQLAQADALLASLSQDNVAMAALLIELQTLTDQANAALEAKANADEAARHSTARAAAARSAALRLADELARKQQQLRDWAFSAYSDGGSTAEMVSVFDALLNDPEEAGNPVGDLAYLTDERVRLFEDIKDLTEHQKASSARAQDESAQAREDAAHAAAAKAAADDAVRKHTEAVAAARENQVEVLRNAAPMAAVLVGMASPEAKRRGEKILAALLENNLDVPDIGSACSDDLSSYPNGRLPASALCPLWMAPGEYAHPSAAVAFQAMSQKFAQDLGRPICVTDSYRSITDQIVVKASRGWWAATPGTSNHGLGKALDLCGGINSFGTIEHLWMRQNAPLFGWFHPSWAAADGRKPEPWHWEYAG